MEQATTIGLDIAKHVLQLHGADAAGHVLFRKRITRMKLLSLLAAQTRCVVAMEACAGAHYWAREIAKLGSWRLKSKGEPGTSKKARQEPSSISKKVWSARPSFISKALTIRRPRKSS